MNKRSLNVLEYEKIKEMVLKNAHSPLGREYIERMNPLKDALVINSRMEETRQAVLFLEKYSMPHFQGIKDIREHILKAAKEGMLQPFELLDIASSVTAFRLLKHSISVREKDNFALLHTHSNRLSEFNSLEKAIASAIDDSGEVRDNASSTLVTLRRQVRLIQEKIQNEINKILGSKHYQDILQEPIVTKRNGRTAFPVRNEHKNAFKGIVHDISASGQTLFMEPLSLVEAGNDLREAEGKVADEIRRILEALTVKVGTSGGDILNSIEAAARLDVIFARGKFSRDIKGNQPTFNEKGIFAIVQAKHPLLFEKAVPIDISLGSGDTSALLITGPNTGGKTVTLKTVGLFVLMAQSGLFVPARPGVELSYCKDVFVDIGDEQSIAQNLSTFSGHINNIADIIRKATAESLVLLDEIGAGTDPSEGAALAKAIILAIHEKGCRLIATTHYGELKIFAENNDFIENASMEFDPVSLKPTYKIIRGLPGSSNALTIAARLGMDKEIIKSAKKLMGEESAAVERLLKTAEGARRALDRERTAITRARIAAEQDAKELSEKRAEYEKHSSTHIKKSKEEAKKILHNARVEANELLDELKTTIKEYKTAAKNEGSSHLPSHNELSKLASSTLKKIDEEIYDEIEEEETPPVVDPLKSVTPGQEVIISTLGYHAIALEQGEGDDEILLQVGIMQVKAKVSELVLGHGKVAPPLAFIKEHAENVPSELKLIGLRKGVAESALEEYLEKAARAHLTRVRIIHGYGSGALKRMVDEFLRSSSFVVSYHKAEPQEGGAGATIVHL